MAVLRTLSHQETVVYSSLCDGQVRSTRTGCVCTILVRESASVASPVGVVLDRHASNTSLCLWRVGRREGDDEGLIYGRRARAAGGEKLILQLTHIYI